MLAPLSSARRPPAGARIETGCSGSRCRSPRGRPPAGARIETGRYQPQGAARPGIRDAGRDGRLSDATFASGANFGWDNNLPAADWTALGLTALAFTAFFPTAAGPSTLTATLADLGPSGPRNAPPYWRLSLASDPGRDPTGWMFFTDNFSSFSVQFQGTASIGIIGSDNGGPCSPASNCTIAATLMRVAVPEPPTLALLGAWVLGFAVLRRRQAGWRMRHCGPPPAPQVASEIAAAASVLRMRVSTAVPVASVAPGTPARFATSMVQC